ncbi:amino acid ABC transporter permease [Acholeplasma laidlawii]|uniref:ABC-type transport system, permease component n=2 Tax=Acholeplasma laidlawii TaxID=2148 RepID=A9NFY6_ACHLI|nr:amino acid ABC transporter permease [Acholeplasma laidlawii]ABX81266.1 ABC-type transport system, permease component [Acholeplasma laidlawii PG-8A]NWH10157.1 amino acid ABC transporter permease [Acholeplasma laidlawii]NWH11546.1 amino acid ABC transporter permease [Acholeplasma laidlawii]NWH13044.1 amino acid ABC transporter permease [Acholeplasma laidlawii]NWH14688.1 amino acid ABC transporter permease [Acholeplasma laidlawii]
MDFSFLLDLFYVKTLLQGVLITIVLALIAVLMGTLIAVIPTYFRLSKHKILNFIGGSYVEIIRGTPLLVQVMLIYAIVKLPVMTVLGMDFGAFLLGMVALIINSSAYASETFRAGILSIEKGQKEAGLSLGMTEKSTMLHIIMPQAIKNIMPSLGNEFVTLIKETSIFMYLGISELMYSAQIVKTSTYRTKEVYIVTALLYFVLTFTTSKLMSKLEKRMRKQDEK